MLQQVSLNSQAMNTLNAVEAIADSGNRKAEKMLQALLNRVTRRNRKAEQGLLPASFVLADLFDVESLSMAPDDVIENDPAFDYVCCPVCDGAKFVEVARNGWVSALFSHPARAYAHRHLNSSFKMCGRCSGVGEVLDDLTSHSEFIENTPIPSLPKADISPLPVYTILEPVLAMAA